MSEARENDLKRSAINRCISEAAAFFAENCFMLPPFASWTPEDWLRLGHEADELRIQRLGWDVTDFNSGDFPARGLTIFTLRNGRSTCQETAKPYAEKIMLVRDRQLTPFHYHAQKTEDIINRGRTARLVVQFYRSTTEGKFAEGPFPVVCDGLSRDVESGGTVVLTPGESITLPPFLYHAFHAIDGDALIGEVSSTNDDDTDNYFYEPVGRYPQIEEDEAPLRLLCNEY
jgi:D-lyxose ketol-isomerase